MVCSLSSWLLPAQRFLLPLPVRSILLLLHLEHAVQGPGLPLEPVRLGSRPGVRSCRGRPNELAVLPIQPPQQVRSIVREPLRPDTTAVPAAPAGTAPPASVGAGTRPQISCRTWFSSSRRCRSHSAARRCSSGVVRVLRAVGDDAALARDRIELQLLLGASTTAGATRMRIRAMPGARHEPAMAKHVQTPDRAAYFGTMGTVAFRWHRVSASLPRALVVFPLVPRPPAPAASRVLALLDVLGVRLDTPSKVDLHDIARRFPWSGHSESRITSAGPQTYQARPWETKGSESPKTAPQTSPRGALQRRSNGSHRRCNPALQALTSAAGVRIRGRGLSQSV